MNLFDDDPANFSYFGGSTQANAIIFKNNAAKARTDAANQWSYYQSKNIRQDISVLIQSIGTEAQATEMADQIQRFENQKKEISEAARRLEEEAKQWDIKSAAELHTHHLWAQAATALQVAIAVAAVALVSRQRVLFYLVVVFAGLGCVLAALTFLPHHG